MKKETIRGLNGYVIPDLNNLSGGERMTVLLHLSLKFDNIGKNLLKAGYQVTVRPSSYIVQKSLATMVRKRAKIR